MHCPNCGANNKKHQNYCRYCGLHLPDIEKLYLSQLVFGEDTKQMKRLRSARKLVDYVQIFIVILFAIGIFRYASSDFDGARDLIKFSIVSFMLLLATGRIISYFHRQSLRTNRRNVSPTDEQREFEARETARLIEEKPFSPVSGLTNASTELLFVDAKSKRAE